MQNNVDAHGNLACGLHNKLTVVWLNLAIHDVTAYIVQTI